MQIKDRPVGPGQPPFIIAEMSGNHNQSLEKALTIVRLAAEAGADAIKLQTYTPDSLTIDHREGMFFINDPNSLWAGRSLYELYQVAMTPYEWHEPIFRCAQDHNLICFSTPFDEDAVDFLEKLGSPAHKIASFENNHLPLLRKVARTGKPVIMSTGLSTLAELAESVATLREAGAQDLVLLKCTSSYPASPENSHLRTIPHMRELFGCEVGLSDHTPGIGVAVASAALGASVIEKHFCISRAEGGVDSAFSLEPHELKALVSETRRATQALGSVCYGVQEAEKKSLFYKRSLYFVEDIGAGGALTLDNVRIIRPGNGLHPRYLPQLLGRTVRTPVQRGTPVSWELLN
jgi:N-acetylneuraminate synthase